jgi:serine/threonine-protein kinase CHEK2
MLTVDPEQRISIDECLEHPWTTGHDMGPAGESIVSTDGLLAGRMGALDFSKRKPVRERTLLSALNEVHVSRIVDDDMPQGQKQPPVTVFAKNVEQPSQSSPQNGGGDTVAGSELEDTDEDNAEGASPSGIRFLATGERGDGVLFAEDEDSRYPEGESFRTLKSPDP